MIPEEIKSYIIDFQKKELPKLIKRELKIDGSNKIKSIIGPRRAGKTYFMYQKIEELISSGVKKENIIYLNFEDPILIDINFKEVNEIIKLHWQIYPQSTKTKLHIFIDEPQNIKKWEIALRSLHDERFNIFLTGSSSKLLSKEIATSLRGRTLSYTLLPFSFKEFIRINSISIDTRPSSREKSILLNLLDEYLEFGGFPEISLEKDKETKLRIINEYFNLVIYRDIVDRYKIKNTYLIRWLIRSLIISFSKEFSIHKAYLVLKSKGVKVSKNTLYLYVSMLQDSLFVFFIEKYDHSIRKREFSINKPYLCDPCFTKLAEISKDKGKKMENVVFLELKRRKNILTEIFYWKNLNHEVDFVVKQGPKIKQLIQVCHNIEDYDTRKRELRALLKASRELKCKELLIITYDYEAEERIKSKKIKFIPLWKWLL